MKGGCRHGKQKGIALVLVLWLVALLTIVAASFATHSKVESRLAGNASDALRAKLMAQSGVNRAIMELLVNDPQQGWNINGQIYPLETEQGLINISIRNSSGLVDLNNASRDLLDKLFVLISDEKQEREALIDRLTDWRDSDDLRRLNGAEERAYRSAGYAYIPTGKDLKSIDELAYVMGFNAARVNRLRPYVTLNSDSANVDIKFAPPELAVLLDQQSQNSSELTEALSQLDSELANLDQAQGGTQAPSRVYRIEVEAITRQGARAIITADLDLKSRDGLPYSIHSWHESL